MMQGTLLNFALIPIIVGLVHPVTCWFFYPSHVQQLLRLKPCQKLTALPVIKSIINPHLPRLPPIFDTGEIPRGILRLFSIKSSDFSVLNPYEISIWNPHFCRVKSLKSPWFQAKDMDPDTFYGAVLHAAAYRYRNHRNQTEIFPWSVESMNFHGKT